MDKLKCTVTLLDLGVTDEVLFVLDQHASLDFFVVLAHWNNSLLVRHFAPLVHIILILSQPVFALSP
jgi:hypothetical protein